MSACSLVVARWKTIRTVLCCTLYHKCAFISTQMSSSYSCTRTLGLGSWWVLCAFCMLFLPKAVFVWWLAFCLFSLVCFEFGCQYQCNWLPGKSPKWPVMCRAGNKTVLTHALNLLVLNCADSSSECFDASLSRSLVSVYGVSSVHICSCCCLSYITIAYFVTKCCIIFSANESAFWTSSRHTVDVTGCLQRVSDISPPLPRTKASPDRSPLTRASWT